MSLLQYTSKEMFSSTELIRKSKMVFDKLQNDEIEKAVILRDGKPSFMLMDFNKYEALINEYLEMKNTMKEKPLIKNVSHETISKPVEKRIEKNENSNSEINNDELEKALAQIDQLELNTTNETPTSQKDKKEQLKDFWE